MSAILTNVALEAAVRLGTLIESHARDAGRQLGEWLRPWLEEGEDLPDFTLVLQLPARMIRHAGLRLRQSQKELDESRSEEGEAQVSRDQTASVLRRKLVEVRRYMTSVFGPRHTATLLGIEGKTAQASQPALLLSQAEATAKLLRDPKRLAIPQTAHFNPAAAAAALEPRMVAFRAAHGCLNALRQASAARLDRGLRCVVPILSGWLGLIRRAELTEKLRHVQRSGKTKKTKKVKKSKKAKKRP